MVSQITSLGVLEAWVTAASETWKLVLSLQNLCLCGCGESTPYSDTQLKR